MGINKENFETLIAWLEAGAPHAAFSMRVGAMPVETAVTLEYIDPPPDDCGTVCCIAGAADQLAFGGGSFPQGNAVAKYFKGRLNEEGDEACWSDVVSGALEWLGLERVATYSQLPDQYQRENKFPEGAYSMGHPLFDFVFARHRLRDCRPLGGAARLDPVSLPLHWPRPHRGAVRARLAHHLDRLSLNLSVFRRTLQ